MRSRTLRHCIVGALPLLSASLCWADLFVVDGDQVDRFNSSTGAVIQTNGHDTFTTQFSATGITVGPDGLVYVADTDPSLNSGGGIVYRYNATTGAQVGGGPFIPFVNGAAQLSNAQGIKFGPDGNFYVADLGDNGPVKAFDNTGSYLTTYALTGGSAQSVAFNPADSANVYIASGSAIEKVNLSTHSDDILIQGSSSTFNDGTDLTFGPDGKLYVLDISSGDPRILRYNADGSGQSVFADFNAAPFNSEVFQPADFAFGPDGALYVSGANFTAPSAQQGEILRIASTGTSFTDFVTGLNAPGFIAFNNVPEPSALLLAAACGGATILRRRDRRI
jgi:WD40 repeat protein